MTEFNYKNIHFWLLSFFGLLVILALTGQIKSAIYSDFIIKYCLFGIIICLISWNIEIKIISKVEDPYFRNYEITDILRDKYINQWISLVILGLTFVFHLLFSDWWLIFYGVFMLIYFITLVLRDLL